MNKRKIAILGSTGSIGTQTLDVIRQHPELFEVSLISAYSSVEMLAAQAKEFDVNNVVICDESRYEQLNGLLQDSDSKVWAGQDSLCSLIKGSETDIVVGAMVGFSGLRPTLAALEAGKTVALANKETLVAAGDIVTRTAKEYGGSIIPVDSEHSAILQCLLGAGGNPIEKIHLTASGGPFLQWSKEQIQRATAAQALKHPNWNMGAKVTIDSASMMNKGFEVMEAKWLFGVEPSRIHVVVHPESLIHSMVEFKDGAIIAQMAQPDMRQPISFALGFPERLSCGNARVDFAKIGCIHFEEPDTDRFPNLALAYEALEKGGNAPCALNAANEVAVAAFLQNRIGFYDISRINSYCLRNADFIAHPGIEDIFETDSQIAKLANDCID